MCGIENIEKVLPLPSLGTVVKGDRKEVNKGYELDPVQCHTEDHNRKREGKKASQLKGRGSNLIDILSAVPHFAAHHAAVSGLAHEIHDEGRRDSRPCIIGQKEVPRIYGKSRYPKCEDNS